MKLTTSSFQVLNMRPQEILGMVEEAAGTRMFEERKDKAKKTMGKKEKRVDEITSLLAEEIIPKLDTLREEKRSFLQWQKSCSELERIARLLRAWEWTEGNQRVAKKEADIDAKKEEISKTKKEKERMNKEIEAAERDCEEVKKKREAELKKGGKLKKKEEEVAELEKDLVKVKTQVDIKKGTIADDKKKVAELEGEAKQVCVYLYEDDKLLTLRDSSGQPWKTSRRTSTRSRLKLKLSKPNTQISKDNCKARKTYTTPS